MHGFSEEPNFNSKDESFLSYWQDMLQALNNSNTNETFVQKDFSELGGGILTNALQIMEDPSSSFAIDDYVFGIWMDLGRVLFTWGCGRMKSAT